jgi:hypothetical protein
MSEIFNNDEYMNLSKEDSSLNKNKISEKNNENKQNELTKIVPFEPDISELNTMDEIQKEKPIEIPTNNNINRKGNCFMFLYNKNGYPLIVIGPHCKTF